VKLETGTTVTGWHWAKITEEDLVIELGHGKGLGGITTSLTSNYDVFQSSGPYLRGVRLRHLRTLLHALMRQTGELPSKPRKKKRRARKEQPC